MDEKKVAIVTGSSKGIGLEIVKELCKQFKGDVFITGSSVWHEISLKLKNV